MPTVLVTGATGFIAGHTIRDLLDHGYSVRGTVRSLGRPERVQHLVDYAAGRPLSFVEADLSSDQGWDAAVAGCDRVVHMASPFPAGVPRDEDELIRPAVDGTERVLNAAARAGVGRVAMTSSTAAVVNAEHGDRPLTEADWSDPATCSPYPKSKTLAERAAWALHAALPDAERFELVVLNPCLVTGPVLSADHSASIEVFRRLLSRSMPGVPDLCFNLVDARDVASAHRLALESDAAPGQRYILTTGRIWLQDIARQLDAEFGPRGFRVPTRRLPYILLWIAARFDRSLKTVLPSLGKQTTLVSDKARTELGWEPIDVPTTIRETAEALVQMGVVRALG